MNSSFCGLDSSNGRALDYCLKGQGFDPGISPKCVFLMHFQKMFYWTYIALTGDYILALV